MAPGGLGDRIAQLFEDDGNELLSAVGAADFDQLLRSLAIQEDDAARALAAIRDGWERDGDVELAALATHALVRTAKTRHGDEAGATLAEVARLGGLYVRSGMADEGSVLVERSWEVAIELLKPGSVARGWAALELGRLRVSQDRGSEAVFPLREAMRDLQRAHPDASAEAAYQLGLVMVEFGSEEEGIRLIEGAVRHARTGEPGPALVERVGMLARMLARRLSPKDAEGLFREGIEAARQVHGEMSPELAQAQAALGALLLNVPGRVEEALGLMDVAVSLLLGSVGPADPATRAVAAQLVERLIDVARVSAGRRDRQLAEVSLQRADAVTREVFGHKDSRLHRIQELAERIGQG